MILKEIYSIVLGVTVFLQISTQKVIPIVNETFEDCTENGKIQMIDLSKLDFYNKNNEMYMNGQVIFKTEIHKPFVVSMTIEQLKYQQWVSSFLNRYVPDFCVQMKSKHEPWFQATKNMHDCPIPANSVLARPWKSEFRRTSTFSVEVFKNVEGASKF